MASHLEPAYRSLGPVHLPVTEALTARSLILPLFHTMSESDLDRVVDVVVAAADRPRASAAALAAAARP